MCGLQVRPRASVLAVSVAVLAATTRVAAAGPEWSVSSAYALDDRAGSKWFDFGQNLSIATHRRLTPHLAVLASAGYSRETAPLLGFVSIPELRIAGRREARVVPVTLGLRYWPRGERSKDPQPFLEIAPALYWYHYEASVRTTGFFSGETSITSDCFDNLAPGLQAAAVVPFRLLGPVGIDMGLSYYLSNDLGPGHRVLAGPEEGFNTLAATLGLWVRPR